MRTALPALIAGLFALVIGAGGMWYFMSAKEPAPISTAGNEIDDSSPDTSTPLKAEPKNDNGADVEDDKATQQNIETLKAWGKEAEKEAREKQEELEAEKAALQSEIVRLEGRVSELEKLAAGPNNLLVGFGKWAEIRELRETEWKEVGDAVQNMNPHLVELTKAILEGREAAPDTMQKIQDQNKRVLSQYGKILGKLPTNSGYNGEFTHPVYFMNMLAAQLEAAGDPLTEQQLNELVEHGEEFDRRWTKLLEGYNDKTYFLTKLIDEAELKEWFIARMFEVTTQGQSVIARPAEVEGYLGLDLYSSGLMLSGNVVPIVAKDRAEVIESVRGHFMQQLGLTTEQLDSAQYIFDDWMNTLTTQLQPRPKAQTQIYQTKEVLASGRAQLTAMKALETLYAFTDEDRAKYRAVQRIALPLIAIQD